tara:strand:- start:97 stop:609 length:513 start_codon:yes stop_codon:yes gene_type:complete
MLRISIFFIFFFQITVCSFGQASWEHQSVRLENKFQMKFRYPRHFEFENFNNETLAFGIKKEDSLIRQSWVISIEDINDWNTYLEILVSKEHIEENCQLKLDTILLDHRAATRIIEMDTLQHNIQREKIILETYSSLIKIILTSDQKDNFYLFLKSIEIEGIATSKDPTQ